MRRTLTLLVLLTTVGSTGAYAWIRHSQGESVNPVAAVRDMMDGDRPTTRDEVVKAFGPPTAATADNDRWEYADRVVFFDGDKVAGWVESDADQADDAVMLHVPTSHTAPSAWRGVLRPKSNARLTSASSAGERGAVYMPRSTNHSTSYAADYQRSLRFGPNAQFTPIRSGLQRGNSRVNPRNNITGRSQWWR